MCYCVSCCRCYDLAAETSVDAKVPVALALFKLNFIFGLEKFEEVSFVVCKEIGMIATFDFFVIIESI